MKPDLQQFLDQYFSFLLSGNVEDFKGACKLLTSAIQSGATSEDLQECMNECHNSAELLCLITREVSHSEIQ